MRLLSLLCGAVLAGCATPRAPIPGLRTELTLLDPSPAVGGPLRVRLTLVNDGPERVVYYDLTRWAFWLVGPDGAPLPFIDGPRSTAHSGDYPSVEPGGRVVLLEDEDLAELYLISKPGLLRITCDGGVAWARRQRDYSEDRDQNWTRDEPSYRSNDLAVEVRAGLLPLKTALAARLHPLTPKDWYFACDWWPDVAGPDVWFIPPDFKSGTGTLRVRVDDGPPLGGETKVLDFEGRPVYLWATGKAEALWPGWRAEVSQALRR